MARVNKTYIADTPTADVPPEHFLQAIADYDAMLVVLPSRLMPDCYVLARRKQKGPGLTERALLHTAPNPDTRMCIAYNVSPVCLIRKPAGAAWAGWKIVERLKARDLWAHGGADKVADMLEEQEAQDEARLKQQIRDDLWARSGDAWRSYQARTGQSTIRFGQVPTQSGGIGEQAAPEAPAASRSTGASGATVGDTPAS